MVRACFSSMTATVYFKEKAFLNQLYKENPFIERRIV